VSRRKSSCQGERGQPRPHHLQRRLAAGHIGGLRGLGQRGVFGRRELRRQRMCGIEPVLHHQRLHARGVVVGQLDGKRIAGRQRFIQRGVMPVRIVRQQMHGTEQIDRGRPAFDLPQRRLRESGRRQRQQRDNAEAGQVATAQQRHETVSITVGRARAPPDCEWWHEARAAAMWRTFFLIDQRGTR
jgi:hypothetical protein